MMEKLKKNFKTIIIGIALFSVVSIVLMFTLFKNDESKKQAFRIGDFTIDSDVTYYTYLENTVAYTGSGIITVDDKENIYFVALNKILVPGGDSDNSADSTELVIVKNGIGKFETYDYGDESEIEKPKYKFEILGYQKLEKSDDSI